MQGMAINPTGTRFSQSSGLQNKHVETFLVDGIRRPIGTQPPRRQINKSTVHTVLQRLYADPILQPALLHRRIAPLTSVERSRSTVRTNVAPPQSYGMYVAGNAETQTEY
jgi:hypothetical protein